MDELLADSARLLGVEWFDYQLEAFKKAEATPGPMQRRCLYFKTGAGKSVTSLMDMKIWGVENVLVITPPSTFAQWKEVGARLGISVDCISHAKFRMPSYKVLRTQAIIADEMHLFGGHDAAGWKKLDRMAKHLQAPLILASATPNYNDVDRVYCIQHILDPHSCKGGFLEFIYQNCKTEQNPFGMMPHVTGFLRYPDAATYLSSLPGVDYLPDDLVYSIKDLPVWTTLDPALSEFGYNRWRGRIMASLMEERHTVVYQSLVAEDGLLHEHVYEKIETLAAVATTPMLIFANHSTVAVALNKRLEQHGVESGLVTGDTPTKTKETVIQTFRDGQLDVLVGTASLATGTDGLDKVCDWLVILDDTDDDSLRRQLIGRIMPRGADADASKKQVYRITIV